MQRRQYKLQRKFSIRELSSMKLFKTENFTAGSVRR